MSHIDNSDVMVQELTKPEKLSLLVILLLNAAAAYSYWG